MLFKRKKVYNICLAIGLLIHVVTLLLDDYQWVNVELLIIARVIAIVLMGYGLIILRRNCRRV